MAVDRRFRAALFDQINELRDFVIVTVPVRLHTDRFADSLRAAARSGASARETGHTAYVVDRIQQQRTLLPFDLGGQARIGDLGVEHRGVHPLVTEVDGSLTVRPRREHDTLRIDGLRPPEKRDHRVNRIDADVHHGAVGKRRIEGIEHDALPELVIARGVLAVAGEVAADRSQTGKLLAHDPEIGIERRNHGLHQHDAVSARGFDHRTGFARIGGQRLLAQHVFAAAHAEDALRRMQGVGRGDIDGIDERTAGHLFERGERMRNPVLRGESVGRSLIARTDRRRLEARILPGAGKHPVGDKARADHSETNLSFHTNAVNILL